MQIPDLPVHQPALIGTQAAPQDGSPETHPAAQFACILANIERKNVQAEVAADTLALSHPAEPGEDAVDPIHAKAQEAGSIRDPSQGRNASQTTVTGPSRDAQSEVSQPSETQTELHPATDKRIAAPEGNNRKSAFSPDTQTETSDIPAPTQFGKGPSIPSVQEVSHADTLMRQSETDPVPAGDRVEDDTRLPSERLAPVPPNDPVHQVAEARRPANQSLIADGSFAEPTPAGPQSALTQQMNTAAAPARAETGSLMGPSQGDLNKETPAKTVETLEHLHRPEKAVFDPPRSPRDNIGQSNKLTAPQPLATHQTEVSTPPRTVSIPVANSQISLATTPQVEDVRPLEGASEISALPVRTTDFAVPSTTAPANAPTILRADAPNLPQRVAEVLVSHTGQTVEIALRPEELGQVRMLLSFSETGATVTLQAERPETLDLMRRHAEALADALRQLGQGSVDFNFQSDQPPSPHNETNHLSEKDNAVEDRVDPSETTQRRVIALQDGLDIRV